MTVFYETCLAWARRCWGELPDHAPFSWAGRGLWSFGVVILGLPGEIYDSLGSARVCSVWVGS